jgi:hypothetical protein
MRGDDNTINDAAPECAKLITAAASERVIPAMLPVTDATVGLPLYTQQAAGAASTQPQPEPQTA